MFFQDKEHKFPEIERKVSRDKLQFQTLFGKLVCQRNCIIRIFIAQVVIDKTDFKH